MGYYGASEARWLAQDLDLMKRSKPKAPRCNRLNLGCERLEVRRVLDASPLPIEVQIPDAAGQSLTLDEGGTATATAQFGDWTYTSSNGSITITKYTGMGGAVVTPAQLDQLPVKAIASGAFQNSTDLTSIHLAQGLTTIGSSAFSSCVNLSSVTIPTSVTSIGTSAFMDCVSLTSIVIPGNVTSIASMTFYGCENLTSVGLPQGLKSIGTAAFANCDLTALNLPVSLTSIGQSAFSNNERLSSVEIPQYVTSIGSSPFGACTSLKSVTVAPYNSNYKSIDGILYGTWPTYSVIQCPAGREGEVTIPSYVADIGAGAFHSCINVQSVVIPTTVKSIGSNAFESCTSLKVIAISSSVLSIGDYAFRSCTSLMAINVDYRNVNYMSIGGMLYSNHSIAVSLIQCPGGVTGTVTIPSGVAGIGNSAFHSCIYVTDVVMPSSIKGIGVSAFESCNSLVSITIPKSVSSIGDNAFRSCRNLQTINVAPGNTVYSSADGLLIERTPFASTLIHCPGGRVGDVAIPSGVTGVDSAAFRDCWALTGITIPATVKMISGYPFGSCTSLVAISVDTANTAYASVDGVLYNKSLTSLVRCPAARTKALSIPSTVTSIVTAALSNCGVLESIRIPAGVQSIGSYALSGCSSLRSLLFEGTPPSLAGFALYGSTGTVYRFAGSPGWSSTYGGRPVEIVQLINVLAGDSTTPAVAGDTSRVLKEGAGTAVLAMPSTRTGGTVVEAGELVVRNKDALGTGLLEVQAGAKATFQTGYDTVAVTSLDLANTSRLELGTSKLSVTAIGLTEIDIRSKLIAGRNGGSWDGTNGITSTFAGGDRAIGYRVADGALEMAFAAPGDSNLDGVIDILDIGDILSAGKFNTGEPANWTQGDMNYDNVFDIVDLADILGTGLFNQGNYLIQGAASSAAVETSSVATFDLALVLAALAMDPVGATTTKRKSS